MRILLFISIFFVSIVSGSFVQAECDLSTTDAVTFLQECANNGDPANAVSNGGDMWTEWVKELLVIVGERVIAFWALFAIGAIVFSGIRYTTSYGDEEKIKKAKSTALYALIGLILLWTAFPFIDIIVSFIYSLGA